MLEYKLEGHKPVPVHDAIEWAEWFRTADRKVARTNVFGAVVSTVFLGLDHGFFSSTPLLFETAVIRKGKCEIIDRYHTWEAAEAGHWRTVRYLRRRLIANNIAQAAVVLILVALAIIMIIMR